MKLQLDGCWRFQQGTEKQQHKVTAEAITIQAQNGVGGTMATNRNYKLLITGH